jgi:hypothetical protein
MDVGNINYEFIEKDFYLNLFHQNSQEDELRFVFRPASVAVCVRYGLMQCADIHELAGAPPPYARADTTTTTKTQNH